MLSLAPLIDTEGPNKGKKLADVPAKDWATLHEIAENPIGTGPYIIKEWKKGEKISYEANPYYCKGKPKTPKIVITFLTLQTPKPNCSRAKSTSSALRPSPLSPRP